MEDRALLVTLPIDGKPLRALVFDLDGTLIVSTGPLSIRRETCAPPSIKA
jgi:hypothetical protein